MKPLIVKILVSIPDAERIDACTLCFDTLRVGFPTADIEIHINNIGSMKSRLDAKERAFKIPGKVSVQMLVRNEHHAEWIKREVLYSMATSETLIILDADTIFWKSVEDWEFPTTTVLAGYFVPRIWNDFAKCISVPRIHTSMMWFPNPRALRSMIEKIYPWANMPNGDYCPCDPFMPATRFINSQPYFWDSCANLYQMLAPGVLSHFTDEHLAAFDHINSASFYDVMSKRIDRPEGFKFVHNELVKTPEQLRNLWPQVNAYYKQKEIEAHLVYSKYEPIL